MAAKPSRRAFLEGAAAVGCAGFAGAFLLSMLPARDAAAHWAPRPPGAREGGRFAAACARCGRCVNACPYGTLRLAGMRGPAPTGTPYFIPRDVPCYMCRDLPCVKACPTGALDPAVTDVREAKMGVAIVDPQSCLSWQGLRCEVCFRACPEEGRAITAEPHPRGLSKHAVFIPVIHPEACTGCGLCEKSCPTDEAAIRIAEPKAVLGAIGRHYRLGWLAEDDPKNTRRAPAETKPQPSNSVVPGLDYLNAEEPL